jgi:hypothetical protein
MNACEAGQIEAIRLILDYDLSSVTYKCENGSPIHAAISGKDPIKIVRYLLSR